MPRGYRSPSAGLMRPGGCGFTPNPHDNENDLLASRARRLNQEKMTPEHFAGYFAFAGISNRSLAAKLHQHFVSPDDVGDYSGLGVGAENYDFMQRLSIAGLTPKELHRWKKGLRGHRLYIDADLINVVTAGVSLETAAVYLDAGVLLINIPVVFKDYGMSPGQVERYNAARPARAAAGLAAAAGEKLRANNALKKDLAVMTAAARHRDLACELVAYRVPPTLAAGWSAHYSTLGVDQCCALIRAGYSAAEVTEHPDLGNSPRDLLEIQAALADLTPNAYPTSNLILAGA
ncbi:hypothetical protein [Tessaracoccus sp.]